MHTVTVKTRFGYEEGQFDIVSTNYELRCCLLLDRHVISADWVHISQPLS